jgi:hypothetical protein
MLSLNLVNTHNASDEVAIVITVDFADCVNGNLKPKVNVSLNKFGSSAVREAKQAALEKREYNPNLTEATEAPKPEATEAPKPEATEAPKPEATEAPKPEATEAPKPEATEVESESPIPVPTYPHIESSIKPEIKAPTTKWSNRVESTLEDLGKPALQESLSYTMQNILSTLSLNGFLSDSHCVNLMKWLDSYKDYLVSCDGNGTKNLNLALMLCKAAKKNSHLYPELVEKLKRCSDGVFALVNNCKQKVRLGTGTAYDYQVLISAGLLRVAPGVKTDQHFGQNFYGSFLVFSGNFRTVNGYVLPVID